MPANAGTTWAGDGNSKPAVLILRAVEQDAGDDPVT